MVIDPATVAFKLAPKLAPLGKSAVRHLLGLNDVVRLLSAVERDVKRSAVIPPGEHAAVWRRVEGQR